MDQESLNTLVKSVDNQLYEIVSHLICSICHELLNNPVTTPCSHTFCHRCISRVISSKNNNGCPLCKSPVHRRFLQPNKVKASLAGLCQELPDAFKKDVEDLTSELKDLTEDLAYNSKLGSLVNQESAKDVKTKGKKRLSAKTKKQSPSESVETVDKDSGSFFPVLKRSKNVVEYASLKKKRMDDLVSISQTEAASNSSLGGPSEVDKKLEKIEKLPPEEKIKEWFEAAGDNIYINSPNSSLLETLQPEPQSPPKEPEKSRSFIRIDYNKTENDSINENSDKKVAIDPYEFIPSQNNNVQKRKRQRKYFGKKKKKFNFEALQSFTKESTIRNNFNREENEMEVEEPEDNGETSKAENLITASQKFDKLLLETKENRKNEEKRHTLFSASQSSSLKFLDCSFHSDVNNLEEKAVKTSTKKTDEESNSCLNQELFVDCLSSGGKRKSWSKRRSTEVRRSARKKKKLTESAEETPLKRKTIKETKLTELLRELINDDVIYPSSEDKPIKFPKSLLYDETTPPKILKKPCYKSPGSFLPTQDTGLIGFGTQEESPEVRDFKNMVANMEEVLESEQYEILKELESLEDKKLLNENEKSSEETDSTSKKSTENSRQSVSVITSSSENVAFHSNQGNTEISTDQSKELVPFKLMGKIKKTKPLFVEFLHLGRLTPPVKRSKSSVVKLVFPMGLSSLAKRRSSNRCTTGICNFSMTRSSPIPTMSAAVQTCQKIMSSANVQTSQVHKFSTMIQTSEEVEENQPTFEANASVQTSQKMFSTAIVQTSQVAKLSSVVQTSQQENPSVEIQTSQKDTSCAEVQTSQIDSGQKFKSMEIQTSQLPLECAAVQTTQFDKAEMKNISPERNVNSCAKSVVAPLGNCHGTTKEPKSRKALFKHKKTVKRKISEEEDEIISSGNMFLGGNESPQKSQDAMRNLILDFEMEKEFEKSWKKNSEKYSENLVELKNQKNIENDEDTFGNKMSKISDDDDNNNEDECKDDDNDDESDIRPLKCGKNSRRILSEESSISIEKYEKRQLVPLNVQKVSPVSDQIELIDLETPKEVDDNSEEQLLKVLKNIDLDLMRNPGENKKEEKNEESDSDFFVEQTPPRSRISDMKIDRSHINGSKTVVNRIEQNSEGTDLIGDSIPKALFESESFLLLSAPEKVILTPKKIQVNEEYKQQKDLSIGKSSKPVEFSALKPNENDQNQLNADLSKERKIKEKSAQVKAMVEAWKRSDQSPKKSTPQPKKKLCVVASSVKNPDMIKKFVNKFKLDYSNKPTKNMTHLIVGLHENEENEVLPLCTPKLLFAVANKKWVVSELWAETCLKMNTILPEESFETVDPIGGDGCKNARLSSKLLLAQCEIYLLGTFQTISKEEFAELITDCGGTLISKPEKFSFSSSKIRMIVADRDCLKMDEKQLQDLHEKYSSVILSRDVIIMSIQSFNLANFYPYLLHHTSEEELLKMGYPISLIRNEEDEDCEDKEDGRESRWTSLK